MNSVEQANIDAMTRAARTASTHGGGPVHPIVYKAEHSVHVLGLTKREYFAAVAMQGMVSFCGITDGASTVAVFAVDLADKLLKALEPKP